MSQILKTKQLLDIHITPLPGVAVGGFWNFLVIRFLEYDR